jgi:Ala-tRNA(Pro) deacylase
MPIANTLRDYLDEAGVKYQLVHHNYTSTCKAAADAAHVPAALVAKPVVLEDNEGYLMAIVPADRRVEVPVLERQTGRRLVLASERELLDVFSDCVKGAVPPVGQAYGVDVVWDDSLSKCPEIYFEAGDHTDLVRIDGRDFAFLMGRARHGTISRPEA